MRCHYISDLHLEAQDFCGALPRGDVLIIAGDLCHASCLDPARTDGYAVNQRTRVLRFMEAVCAAFPRVLLVPGNHDHYDGVFDETATLLRRNLPVTVLDNTQVEIDGICFFGTTLWTDFDDRSQACMDHVRRRCGEFFFVKTHARGAGCDTKLVKFQPEHALAAFDRSWEALKRQVHANRRTVVISHHPPSRHGLNPLHKGNGIDGAFASDLDVEIASWTTVPVWVHGHTHIRHIYRIGETVLRANCRGFEGNDMSARGFSAEPHFDV